MTSLHLLCLTTNGGLPVFNNKWRLTGELPFSTVATLNATYMFFKSLGITLTTTHAGVDWTYIWRDFHNTVTLIICSRGMEERRLHLLAELVFTALALFISRDELLSLAHSAFLERMKKISKNYKPIVDAAIEASMNDMLGFTDCVFTTENVYSHLLQRLNAFSGSLFCSIVADRRIVAATEGWWDLDVMERESLLLLLNSSNTMQNDVPVYLPKRSPNVAYRFVTIPISGNCVLCIICGAEPPYRELQSVAQNIFRNEAVQLQAIERSLLRSLPDHFEIDQNVLALIFANTVNHRCIFTRNLHQNSSSKRGVNHRLEMIKKFFDQTLQVMRFFQKENRDTTLTVLTEQYWCLDYHKCYAQIDEQRNMILLLLFPLSVPNYAMKFLAQKVLGCIMQNKSVCW